MARYIDADELMEKIKKCEFDITGCGIMYDAGGVQSAINTQRTADVVPKSEAEHWREAAEEQSVLWKQHFESIYETGKETFKAEVVREIFEDIEIALKKSKKYDFSSGTYFECYLEAYIAELKKKYEEPKV